MADEKKNKKSLFNSRPKPEKSKREKKEPTSEETQFKRAIALLIVAMLIVGTVVFVIVKNVGDEETEDVTGSGAGGTNNTLQDPNISGETPDRKYPDKFKPEGIIEEGYGNNRYDDSGKKLLTVNTDVPEYDDGYLPKKGEVNNPSDTGYRGEPEEGLDYLTDESKAPMSDIATIIGQAMLSPRVTTGENGGYKGSITSAINRYGTEHAKKFGFRPWYIGDEHTTEWKAASAREGTKIVSSAKVVNEEFYTDDIVRVRISGSQRMVSGNSYVPMGITRLDLYMKYVDGKWLLEAYQFPEGSSPSFY